MQKVESKQFFSMEKTFGAELSKYDYWNLKIQQTKRITAAQPGVSLLLFYYNFYYRVFFFSYFPFRSFSILYKSICQLRGCTLQLSLSYYQSFVFYIFAIKVTILSASRAEQHI